jgi:PAP2 superfamily
VRSVGSRHDGLAQIAVVLGAVGAYESARLALRPDWPLALDHARRIAALERVAHLAWEAPLQHLVLQAPPLVEAMNAFYLLAHFAVTGVFFLWLYRRTKPGFRLFRNAFLLATAIALGIAWQFPTAPPRVAGIGLVDTLRHFSDIDIGSPGSGGLSDPVAAVPSLHAGWAVGVAVGVLLYARSPALRAAAAIYPFAVILTILATGNHFVVDALSGVLVMAIGLGLAALLGSIHRPGRPRAPSAGRTRPKPELEVPAFTRVLRFPMRRGVEQPGSSPGS